MKKIGLTISGNRYEVNLEENFADFVIKDLQSAGVAFDRDNNASGLLKAYLRLAKLNTSYEDEIELLIETLDGI
jgi:hypothetical protein